MIDPKNAHFIAQISYVSFYLSVATVAPGQSSFWLNNYRPPRLKAPVFDAVGVPLQGSNYLAELWGGATSDSLTPLTTLYTHQRIIIPFQSPAGAGYFLDSYAGRDGGDHLSVMTVPPFDWAWLEVRAWDARLGGTYEMVQALGVGGYGESTVFYAKGTGEFGPPPALPALLIGLQSFSLLPVVPEPSTWALLGFGGGGFLWFARRYR